MMGYGYDTDGYGAKMLVGSAVVLVAVALLIAWASRAPLLSSRRARRA